MWASNPGEADVAELPELVHSEEIYTGAKAGLKPFYKVGLGTLS